MSMADADKLMQQWAYQTFDGDDIPMCDISMMKLPEGYNGFSSIWTTGLLIHVDW